MADGTFTGETTAPTSNLAPAAPAATPESASTVESGTPALTTSETPTTAPTTMAEGFAQLEQQAQTKTVAAPTVPTSPAAENVPTPVDPAAPGAPAKQGPVPFAQHKAAIENARRKGAEEATQNLAWAKQYHPQQVQAALEIVNEMRRDTVGFARQLVQELQADPRIRQQVQRERQTAQGPPQPDVVTNDGSTKLYSEKGTQALVAYHVQRAVQQVLDQVGQRISPIEQERQQRVEQQARTQLTARAEAEITDYETKPLFKENLPAILAEMEKDGRLGLAGAYARVVVPQLSPQRTATQMRAEIKAELLREIQGKAGAGSFNPSAPSAARVGATPHRSTAEAFREGFRRLGGKL